MKPNLSFNYNGTRFQADGDGPEWKIDDTLEVTLKAVEYPEFNAVHWLLEFANPSDRNSGILSDIWDCDVLLPLPYVAAGIQGTSASPAPRPSYP